MAKISLEKVNPKTATIRPNFFQENCKSRNLSV